MTTGDLGAPSGALQVFAALFGDPPDGNTRASNDGRIICVVEDLQRCGWRGGVL